MKFTSEDHDHPVYCRCCNGHFPRKALNEDGLCISCANAFAEVTPPTSKSQTTNLSHTKGNIHTAQLNHISDNLAMYLKKNKTTAMLLALFFGAFTWIYTYAVDGWKFWVSLVYGITIGPALASIIIVYAEQQLCRQAISNTHSTSYYWLIEFGIFILVLPWIWAVIATAQRPKEFYEEYFKLLNRT